MRNLPIKLSVAVNKSHASFISKRFTSYKSKKETMSKFMFLRSQIFFIEELESINGFYFDFISISSYF